MGAVKNLGRLPFLPTLDAAALGQAFEAHFSMRDFEAADGG
jgi:hypothetical protein